MVLLTSHLFLLHIMLLACASNSTIAEQQSNANLLNNDKEKPERENINSRSDDKSLAVNLNKDMIANSDKTYAIQFLTKKTDDQTFIVLNLKNGKTVYKETTDLEVNWYDETHIVIGKPVGNIQADSNKNGRGYLINILTGKKIWRN